MVWGTLGLERLNATTTTVEDYGHLGWQLRCKGSGMEPKSRLEGRSAEPWNLGQLEFLDFLPGVEGLGFRV